MHRATVALISALLSAAALALPLAALPVTDSGTSVRDVRGFDKVELSAAGRLVLVQGSTESLEIEASAEDLARISTSVSLGTLRIGQVRPGDSPRGPITYRLTMKNIAGLATSSSGTIEAARIDTETLALATHSSGSITVGTLAARTLAVEISSSGNVTVAGTVERQTLTSSSSGEYRAEDLASREAVAKLSSSGRATLSVSETLTGSVSSSGDLRYRGNPTRVTVTTNSSGRVVKLD